MRKLLVLTGLFALMLSFNARANYSNLFQVDENSIAEKFQNLNQLENFVNQHEDITLCQMQESDNPLVSNVNSTADTKDVLETLGMADFDWGTFMGGVAAGVGVCVLGCVISYIVAAASIANAINGY